ncbi:MAG TPA: membrane protein insertase YidC [Catalimonadaceae bacterium]|nr:membrane protein insertase YidC [Catalimonadaceae bacterium]HPI10765.1 membrane protein insertase YidC [Catalimonadaceae bacterium]
MDRNQATGLVLIFGILFVYFTFFAPKPENLPQVKKGKDSVKVQAPAKVTESQLAIQNLQASGIADSSVTIDTIPVWMENDDLKIKISPIGARITEVTLKKFKTWDAKPLQLISEGRSEQKIQIPVGGKSVNVSLLPFTAGKENVHVTKDSIEVVFQYAMPGSGSISQRYCLLSKGYQLKYNLSTSGIQFPGNSLAECYFNLNANQLEKDLAQNRTTTCINFYSASEGFSSLSETTLTEEKKETPSTDWISFKQKFFNVGFIGNAPFSKVVARQKTNEADSLSVKQMEASISMPIANNGFGFRYFLGPNKFGLLKSVAPEYDKNVYLGWPVINLVNRFITVNVFYWLEGAISSYGVIIIILVLLIKLLLLPLSYKSYISMAKMKVLKPELDEIKARTGDDMQKAQAEQMKLYQQVGINPLSGCIPLLLQMPILLAMFNFFPNAIELRQQSFWWAPDLSSYDSIATLPFSLPGYGDHVSLFTILMTASTLVLTWYNNQTSTVAGPMQSMSYIMPVVFMFILNSLPAGLSFYYLVSNVVSIVQQQVIKRFVDEGTLRQKLEDNKVKNANKKKTGFAARLEEAMRIAQETQKEKDKQKKGK